MTVLATDDVTARGVLAAGAAQDQPAKLPATMTWKETLWQTS